MPAYLELRWFHDWETGELVLMQYWGDNLWNEGQRKPTKGLGKELERALKARIKKYKSENERTKD